MIINPIASSDVGTDIAPNTTDITAVEGRVDTIDSTISALQGTVTFTCDTTPTESIVVIG